MNGQNPENLNSENNLSSTTLGSINTTSSASLTPEQPIDSLMDMPIAQPIPGTESIPNVGKMDNIGKLPPENNNTKKKGNKLLFILLIILLIAGVAFGVYYLLYISKNNVKITPQNITIGVGDIVPDDVKSYAKTFSGDASKCSVNINNVNSNVIGEYPITITCNNKTYDAKVIVSDIKAPTVEMNVVFKTVNTSVKIEDFVKSCTDPSNCKTSFANAEEVENYLQTPGGPYKVTVVASDDAGNKANYTTDLYVTSSDVFVYLGCTSNEEEVLNYSAKKVISDIFAINRDLGFLNVARRDYIYKFTSDEEYKQVSNLKPNELTFDNITGQAIYNDEKKEITIGVDLSIDTLNSENNNAFPTTYTEIQKLYQEKGYPGTQILKSYHDTSDIITSENENDE